MPRDWLRELIGVFPSNALDAAEFEAIPADAIPEPERTLLDHHHHMTVTLEAHHGVPVHIRVIEVHHRGNDYARKLTLSAGPDGPTVLAGIMRFDLARCDEEVGREIVAARTPLGRILIEHGVMRRLETVAFLRVPLAGRFGRLFGLDRTTATHAYGRLAVIFCDEEPAVELLEVVAPRR